MAKMRGSMKGGQPKVAMSRADLERMHKKQSAEMAAMHKRHMAEMKRGMGGGGMKGK